MRLLFDESLSPRLTRRLEEVFPGSEHVQHAGLRGKPDVELWKHAGSQDFIVVSKDNDFRQLCFVKGHPPKVIWSRVGNAGTDAIADLLEKHRSRVLAFFSNPDESLLVVEPSKSGS